MAKHERRDTEEREARLAKTIKEPPSNGHHAVTAEAVARS